MSDLYTTANGTVYAVTPVYTSSWLFGTYISSYSVTITDPDGQTASLTGLGTSSVAAPDTSVTSIGLATAFGLGSTTAVVAPGTSANISYSGLLGSNTFYIGGSATITNGVSAGVSNTLNIDGGTASLGAGLGAALGGTTVNLTNGGSFVAGSGLINFLGSTTINYGAGGGIFVADAGGAFLNISSTTINNFNKAGDFLEFRSMASAASFYTIDNSGGSQIVNLLSATGQSIVSVTVAGLSLPIPLPFTGAHTLASRRGAMPLASGPTMYSTSGPGPLTVTRQGGNTYVEPVSSACFLAGAPIATPKGECLVEDLRPGQQVLAFEGGRMVPREIVWVGMRRVRVDHRVAEPDLAGVPVRVRRGALADNTPNADLLLTAEHCLYLNGGFIPVRMLVNNISIVYDRTIVEYTYHHVETADHSIIMAAGTLTESYLDTGNRRAGFTGAEITGIGAEPAQNWVRDAAAPLIVDRSTVEALHAEILARTGKIVTPSVVSQDPALSLMLPDGRVIWPHRGVGRRRVFVVPDGVGHIWLCSRSGRPCDVIGPFVDDRRKLGVLIGDVRLWGAEGAVMVNVHLDTAALEGWHGLEPARMRWTAGRALLPLPAGSGGLLAIEIVETAHYAAVVPQKAGAA